MLREFREEVRTALSAALSALELPADDLGLEDPPGDVDAVVASSVAFRVADEAGAPPPAVAEQVAAELDLDDADHVAGVEPTGPYLNFVPGDAYHAATVAAAREDDYGHLESTGESCVVEHTSANPTGPVHVGRARNPIIGDAVANVLDAAGHDVERHYYVNDAGRQMAVFTWAYETFDEADLPEPEREKPDYELVRYYRAGNDFLEEADEEAVAAAEEEIRAIIQGMEDGDEETFERVAAVVDEVLAGMQASLDRLGVEFDEFVKETRFMRSGESDDVVARLRDAPEAERDDGAWVLDLEEWGVDKEFVFLRSDGTTLYTTRDLAHHEWKFDNFDRAVTVLGEDQELHARQLHAALEILGHGDRVDDLEELFYGWVDLPGGASMSTRAGTGVDLDDLLDEAEARAREEVEARLDDRTRGDLDDDDVARIARQVGVGAVRYDIVAKQPTKTITFEWDRALDFEAQSAPYVQYVHARACGILEDVADPPADVEGPFEHPAERALAETLARFPAVVEDAAADRRPHRVATYTRDVAEAFNAFYRECPVLDADGADRDRRLALVAGARTTVANALALLGVPAPETM
jgi:arginyl-tRNA synthetase